MNEKRFVVVTTDNERRGVFGGYLKEYNIANGTAILENAYMAVYWSSNTKSVFGLASIGPQQGSRISPKVNRVELNGVTSVTDCSDESIEQWEKEIWS